MMKCSTHHNFTVGIDDDLTHLSLDTDKTFTIENSDVQTAILYGIGSDGTVGAVKNIVKIVGENSDLYPQSYAVYDSKKSGGVTQSHIRFSAHPIKSEYLVDSADFICVSNFMIAQRFDVFSSLRAGGTVMINTSLAPEEAFAKLPKSAQEHLIRMRADLYFLDPAVFELICDTTASIDRKDICADLKDTIPAFFLPHFYTHSKSLSRTWKSDKYHRCGQE